MRYYNPLHITLLSMLIQSDILNQGVPIPSNISDVGSMQGGLLGLLSEASMGADFAIRYLNNAQWLWMYNACTLLASLSLLHWPSNMHCGLHNGSWELWSQQSMCWIIWRDSGLTWKSRQRGSWFRWSGYHVCLLNLAMVLLFFGPCHFLPTAATPDHVCHGWLRWGMVVSMTHKA